MAEHKGEERDALEFPKGLAAVEPTARFLEVTRGYGLSFDGGEIEQLGRYLALLFAANELVNLTAIKDTAEAWERHIFDSLTLMAIISEMESCNRVVDVGAGGGLPGIPLAIVNPAVDFRLVESTGKKAAFLEHAIGELGLGNVKVVRERAELAMGWDGRLRHGADLVVARALGVTRVALELTSAAVRVGGKVALIKGQKAEEELADAKHAMHVLCVEHVATVDTATGKLVVFEKMGRTPKTYPRRAGEPKRTPL